MRLSIKRRILKGNKQTPEQYKKSLKNKLDRIERKEEDKTGSIPGIEPVKEKKKDKAGSGLNPEPRRKSNDHII